MKLMHKKNFLWVVPLLMVLGFGSFFLKNLLTSNIHTVVPDQLYRSAQLEPKALAYYVNKYHIRTVVNLRGAHPGETWYDGEIQAAAANHLSHYDVALKAHGLPPQQRIQALAAILQSAPSPILVHCMAGADRTGLASAMWLILHGYGKDAVTRQVSWRYNALSPTTVGYEVMRNYFAWLQKTHFSYGKDSFSQWLHSSAGMRLYHGAFI